MNTSVDHDTAAMSSASPDVNSSSHTDGTGQVNSFKTNDDNNHSETYVNLTENQPDNSSALLMQLIGVKQGTINSVANTQGSAIASTSSISSISSTNVNEALINELDKLVTGKVKTATDNMLPCLMMAIQEGMASMLPTMQGMIESTIANSHVKGMNFNSVLHNNHVVKPDLALSLIHI